MNLVGQRFGRLQVIGDASRKGFVTCKCECGNIHEIRASSLTKKNPTTSCGCYHREAASVVGKNTIHRNSARRIAINEKYGTNVGIISSTKLPRNNKSGHKGVWYDPVHGVYHAYITFQYKRHMLGIFKNLADAIRARQEAEEQLFAPIIKAAQEERAAQ